MSYEYTMSDDGGIYVDGKFLFSVSPMPFMPSDERKAGESWLEMRERTEPDRILAYQEAKRIASVLLQALESDNCRLLLAEIAEHHTCNQGCGEGHCFANEQRHQIMRAKVLAGKVGL